MHSRTGLTLLVIAKEPVPGHVKTRLTPVFSPEEAARLAEAALVDTLAAVRAAEAARRILVLDGQPGPWLPAGFEVVRQVSGGLDLRLAAAFLLVNGPALLIGMDTPQLTPADLSVHLSNPTDALLGLCPDGGFWGIGMGKAAPSVFPGVPMSTERTGELQRKRLRDNGFRVHDLPTRHDVDTAADAWAVATAAPHTRFAQVLQALLAEPDRSPLPLELATPHPTDR
ncbi:MAG: TIGR04282 family arsenosugar biosynthesis glycosyltransferase [Actinomycetota bacterium]